MKFFESNAWLLVRGVLMIVILVAVAGCEHPETPDAATDGQRPVRSVREIISLTADVSASSGRLWNAVEQVDVALAGGVVPANIRAIKEVLAYTVLYLQETEREYKRARSYLREDADKIHELLEKWDQLTGEQRAAVLIAEAFTRPGVQSQYEDALEKVGLYLQAATQKADYQDANRNGILLGTPKVLEEFDRLDANYGKAQEAMYASMKEWAKEYNKVTQEIQKTND